MCKLLMIDDEEINDLFFSTLIEEIEEVESYHFISNGWDALAYLNICKEKGEFPDLIFVDLNMPEMDGFDFILYFEDKFYHDFPNTKILVLTNSLLEKDRKKALSFTSVGGYINKPISGDKIMEIIRT